MPKIMLITVREKNKRTGEEELVVSHGIDLETEKTIITSNEPPQFMGAKFDHDMGEWVLDVPDVRKPAA
jgi:hypothetical protein